MFPALKNTLTSQHTNKPAALIVVLTSALMLCAVCPAGGQAAQAGWVIEARGQWAVSGAAAILTKAASVPAGGQLVNIAPQDGDFIQIADLHGELLRSLRCSNTGCGQCVNENQCSGPIEPLPQALEQPTMLSAAWEGLMDLFVGQPEHYSVHRSRSLAVETCIADGIASLDLSGEAHLDGLMSSCAPGDYGLNFAPMAAAGTGNTKIESKQYKVDWNHSEHSTEPIKLAPGLYLLTFSRDIGNGVAWVLVPSPPEFEKEKSSFEQFSAEIDGWGPQVGQDSKVAYKRAYLDYLSRPRGGANQGH